MRLIVSYSGSPFYSVNIYIANILEAYVKDGKNNSKNSSTFLNYITNVPIEDDKIMASFDVTSCFDNSSSGNIPVADTLNVIKD